jgi:hypothetical protein
MQQRAPFMHISPKVIEAKVTHFSHISHLFWGYKFSLDLQKYLKFGTKFEFSGPFL